MCITSNKEKVEALFQTRTLWQCLKAEGWSETLSFIAR